MIILRSELFRRVWTTPIRTLAKEFDLSDVGLAKACRKHQIPLPPVGHWAKVEHGKPVSRPPLPSSDDIHVVLDANRHRPPPLPATLQELIPAVPAIRIPDGTEPLTPYASATLKTLSRQKPDDRGIVSSQGDRVFYCAISPNLVGRAVKILHAVEAAIPAISAQLVEAPEENQLQVERGGVRLTFKLYEKYTSSFEVLKDPKFSWNDRRIYSYARTGELKLQIEGSYEGRKSWADAKRESLEQKLGQFVHGLVVGIESIREKREHWARQQIAWAEAARVREEMERQRRADEAFTAQVLKEAGAWRDFELGSSYLNLIRLRLGEEGCLSVSAQAWLQKAELLLSSIDPTIARIHQLRTSTD